MLTWRLMACLKLPYRQEKPTQLKVCWKKNRKENPCTGVENYKYNGKELQSELGLNWTDYGARMYQADIGRWGVIDAFAEKYPTQSPYNYAGNSPTMFVDINGDSLFLNFQDMGALYGFLTETSNALGGQFEVSLTAIEGSGGTFNVGLKATKEGGDVNKLSKGSQAFYRGLKGVIDNKKVTEIDIVQGDENVATGNYKNNVIDIGDVQAFPKFDPNREQQNGPTSAGKLIHEIREQFGKSLDGRKKGSENGFNSNHSRAIDFENKVNQNERLPDRGAAQGAVIQSFKLKNGNVVQFKINGVGSKRILTIERIKE